MGCMFPRLVILERWRCSTEQEIKFRRRTSPAFASTQDLSAPPWRLLRHLQGLRGLTLDVVVQEPAVRLARAAWH